MVGDRPQILARFRNNMKVSSEALQFVERLCDNLISGVDEDRLGLRRFAAETEILPLMPDWSGFFGIDQHGQVVAVTYDNIDAPHLVEDERVCNMVLFRGSKLYPDLSFLEPIKPEDAQLCPTCSGTGIVPNLPSEIANKIICYCGGLGWVPKKT